MDMKQLKALDGRVALTTKLAIFSPLVSYMGESGNVPRGTVITITGDPGTGKTRLMLQILENIAKWNNGSNPSVYSYENGGAALYFVCSALKIKNLDHFVTDKPPEFKSQSVVGIDSLDEWALAFTDKNYPDVELAKKLEKAKREGSVIFLVHHKTKSSKKESGSVFFQRKNDIIIELLKQKDGTVLATTRRKNRYPGPVDQLVLEHTPEGLRVKKDLSFKGAMQSLWTRLTQ